MKFILFLGVLALIVCLIQAQTLHRDITYDQKPCADEYCPDKSDICDYYCITGRAPRGYSNSVGACVCSFES